VTRSWTREPLAVALVALAAFRITRLLQRDTILDVPRDRFLDKHAADRWGELVNCPWCLGFWVSVAVVLAATLLPRRLWEPAVVALASSAVVGLTPMGG
jgi:hypothetical protein